MCKDQKGGWCKLLVKKNGTIRVQHLKQYDLGCYRCHKLKQVRISELGQARIFYSFVCFSDPSFFYPAKGLHSGGLNQRYTAGKKPIFFCTFIYIDEQSLGKLLSHYQFSKIQAAHKIPKYEESIRSWMPKGCISLFVISQPLARTIQNTVN